MLEDKSHYTFQVTHRANQPDRNGRVWPEDTYDKAMNEAIERGLYVTLGQPNSLLEVAQVDLRDVVGQVIQYNPTTKECVVEASSRVLPILAEAGYTIGITTRGVGTVTKNADGTETVNEDLRIMSTGVSLIKDSRKG